jgi:hypothetical protein
MDTTRVTQTRLTGTFQPQRLHFVTLSGHYNETTNEVYSTLHSELTLALT